MTCCFCGGDTATTADGEYVELQVRFPAFDGPMRQFFGAHARCFDEATTRMHRIENPLADP
jgi:hypothetical protein